jgi:acetoin utilization deacetylase AcuC-like enzyme
MSLILISSERFAEHQTPPGHPERPARAEVMDVIASRWRKRGVEVVAPRQATHEQLVRVHTPEYLKRIHETAGQAVALDPDTYTSPDSFEVAQLAAGAAIDAVERVMQGVHTSALAMVRPPGHHAERNRAMGFCLYNNVAVAAAHARTLGAARVAIVDYDVHHGNGTQHTFEADASVLYVSLHQYPFYPGTGASNEIGSGPGLGFTVNVALEAGAVDEDYRAAFAGIVTPVVEQFEPDIILVSAGFDAHERDPLGGMRLTTPSFPAMTLALRRVADACCGGRIVLVTEGGYDLHALADCLDGVVDTLVSAPGEPAWPTSGIASTRGEAAISATQQVLAPFWKLG